MTDIESLSASLVREYLSRKGLKRSLRVLDDEFPREENSIRNRVVLAKELKIEKLLRINKQELECPLRTMIEVMVKFFINEKHMKRADPDERKEYHSRKQSLKKDKETKSGSNLLNDQQSDPALRISERISTEGARKISDKKIAHDDKPSNRDGKLGAVLHPAKSNEYLGIDEDNISLSRSKGSLKPLSEGSLSNRIKGSGIHRTMEKSRKQKSKKSINLSSNGGLFSTSDLDLGSKNNTGSTEMLLKNRLDDEQDIFAAEKQKPISFRTEETRHKDFLKKKSVKPPSDILVFDEVDSDFSDDNSDIRIGQPTHNILSKLHKSATPITLELASSLKTLVFGSASKSFNSEWKSQSFSFCDLPDLEYGIVQIKGGPCGVLAAMQATVLKFLMFSNDKHLQDLRRPPNPSSKERTNALIESIAEILWRAGAKMGASVVTLSIKEKFIGGVRYRSDGITETLTIYEFVEFNNLKAFISQNISQFESESSSGCIMFLYSLVFSRGIQRIKEDMDEANGTLVGAHGYCTQELVSLCLTGKAVSNVFDGNMELDSGGDKHSLLKGIERQSDIGLLSLFEHYESCKVGDNYKTPKCPIWVVCSESHFTTLFSIDEGLLRDKKLQRRFDLYYYDGLARQDEEIRLTIDTRGAAEDDNDDLIPPLEHCIRTRWQKAIVNWNHTEPIL